jgi:hypothetical protein
MYATVFAYLFVIIAIAVRVLAGTGTFATHGFTPVGAALLFFGSRMSRKQFWVPVALLIASDIYLNFQVYHLPITGDQMVVWAWYVGACLIGLLIHNRIKPLYVAGAAVGSSVSFFLITNFAVWAAGNVAYPKTFSGLLTSYAAGLPFFRPGLVSDLLFSAIFFGLPVLLAHTLRSDEGENEDENKVAQV